MATKTKTFDCVEMKRKAQEEIMAQWSKRKHEFSSYGEFLETEIKESQWGRRIWKKLSQKKTRTHL